MQVGCQLEMNIVSHCMGVIFFRNLQLLGTYTSLISRAESINQVDLAEYSSIHQLSHLCQYLFQAANFALLFLKTDPIKSQASYALQSLYFKISLDFSPGRKGVSVQICMQASHVLRVETSRIWFTYLYVLVFFIFTNRCPYGNVHDHALCVEIKENKINCCPTSKVVFLFSLRLVPCSAQCSP